MALHKLKTWPEYFAPLWEHRKCFELRADDRAFDVGDDLQLREWSRAIGDYTGRYVEVRVTFILRDFPGLQPGYCILGWWPR
jgi:hypothetical protein